MFAFCCLLPWLPITQPASQHRPSGSWRFGLRSLVIFTTAATVILVLLTKLPSIAGGMVCAIATANLIRVTIQNASLRLPALAFSACMILPYAWVMHYAEHDRILSHFLTMIATWPTFFPAAYVSGLLGQHFRDSSWLAILLTACDVAVGT